MSQTCLLSGIDTSSSVLNLHYSPDAIHHDHLAHLSAKSPWSAHSSSLMDSSFTARRAAASSLPQFSLPPPDHLSTLSSKFPAYAASSAAQTSSGVLNTVLSPPTGLASDLSPSVNSNTSSASSNGGIAPYQPNPMGYWPTPQNSNPQYSYSSAPSVPATYAQGQSYMGGNRLYSLNMNFPGRGNSSPTSGEGLPPPPYDISQPSFPTSTGSSGGQQHSPPALAAQHPQSHQMHSSSQAPSQGPLHAADSYNGRPASAASFYTPASTPQQSSFPAYTQQSPTHHSPPSSISPSSRISPVSAHGSMSAPQGYHQRPYSGYNLPAMSGPIMSNVHNPGNQMALVGGSMQMQYAPHQMGAPMYGHHGGQQQPPTDRPFKCDQCQQSFNRNHDLKRHKRIHLAVKPFPCGHCEKSFSRKDALKRHILVKGCGTKSPGQGNGSASPVDRSELMSDSADDSPEMSKKEL